MSECFLSECQFTFSKGVTKELMNINSGARGSIYSDLSNTLKGRGDKNRGGPRFMSSFISHFSNLRLKFLPFKVHILRLINILMQANSLPIYHIYLYNLFIKDNLVHRIIFCMWKIIRNYMLIYTLKHRWALWTSYLNKQGQKLHIR